MKIKTTLGEYRTQLAHRKSAATNKVKALARKLAELDRARDAARRGG